MARPYAPVPGHGRYYGFNGNLRVPAGMRPNKLSAGMTFTRCRIGQSDHATPASHEALTLAVYGTLDPLARTNKMKSYRQKHYKQVHVWVKI